MPSSCASRSVYALAVVLVLGSVRLDAVQAPVVPNPQGYTLAVWPAEGGLPPGDVFALAQDLEGYLWLGTPAGLIRFDGSRFTPWSVAYPDRPLPDGPVHSLIAAEDGSLWVGFGGGGGVVRIEGQVVSRFAPADGAPPGATAIIQDREQTIWVGGRRGLFRFSGDRWHAIEEEDGYSGAEVYALYEDRAGTLWIGATDGVYRRTHDRFELVEADATNVRSIAEDASGALWITDPDRVLRQLTSGVSPSPAPGIRLPQSAWRLLEDRRGQLWVAAFGGGLLRVRDPGAATPVLERVEYEHRLAGSPRALYQDREQNIWIGMRGGLIRLSETSFETATPLEGLAYDGVRTAVTGPDGDVWVATAHALNQFGGGTHTAYDVPQTLALHVDRHRRLWVATAHDLGHLVGERVVPAVVPAAARASRVMALTTDARDTLWLCSALNGVMAWDGTDLRLFESEPAIFDRSCNSVYTDRRDRVWMGFTGGGAAVHDQGRLQLFGAKEGLTTGTVLAILEDRSGAVWLSTTAGVTRVHHGRLVAVTRAHGPMLDLVPVLVEDEEGYIWVGVNSGSAVVRFHPSEVDKIAANPSYQMQYAYFDESNGMQQGSQTWQAGVGGVRGGDGRIWVATGLGMAVIDPRDLPPSRRPSPPRIERVAADGRRLPRDAELALPAGTGALEIEYSAISLTSPSKLRFRHRLEGADADWVLAGRSTTASYTNLPSGQYQFRVASTHDGQWVESAPLAIIIAPPFYRTPRFIALSITLVVSLLAVTWWLRMRAVREQYALVFAERARVSREIHDTLLQSLAAIGVELETIASQVDPQQGSARDSLRRLRRQVGHSIREARDSILELRHNKVRLRPLADSLREFAATTSRTRGVQIGVSVIGRVRRPSVDADFQLFRIAQEAVGNALKHGRAGDIRVELAYEPNRVRLTVTDDGCGFTPDAAGANSDAGEAFGLLTMRERSERINGRLRIESSPGRGATLEVVVPVQDE